MAKKPAKKAPAKKKAPVKKAAPAKKKAPAKKAAPAKKKAPAKKVAPAKKKAPAKKAAPAKKKAPARKKAAPAKKKAPAKKAPAKKAAPAKKKAPAKKAAPAPKPAAPKKALPSRDKPALPSRTAAAGALEVRKPMAVEPRKANLPEPRKANLPQSRPTYAVGEAKATGVMAVAVSPSRVFASWPLPADAAPGDTVSVRVYDVSGGDIEAGTLVKVIETTASESAKGIFADVDPGRQYIFEVSFWGKHPVRKRSNKISTPPGAAAAGASAMPEEHFRHAPGGSNEPEEGKGSKGGGSQPVGY